MRIAYVCADLGIPALGHKGASVHMREFTNALVELGHDVHLVSAAGTGHDAVPAARDALKARLTVLPPSEETEVMADRFADRLLRLGWPRDPAHVRSEMRHVLADAEFTDAALPVLRNIAPDLLIARHAIFSVSGFALARALGCPGVLEVNAPLSEERRRYWGLTLVDVAEQAERKAFAGADQLVAVSEGVRAYLLRCGAPADRIVVLPNGVNLAAFHPAVDGSGIRRRYGLEGRVVVGFAGSLKPWHGVELLLRAFADVHFTLAQHAVRHGDQSAEAPELHLLVIGDGPQRESLVRLAHELNVGARVTFTGIVPHEDVPAHLAALDIAVAPYLASDGFYFSPLKVIEYLAMGRPVVAPLLGQIPSLLQDGSDSWGLLYRPDDRHELGRALLRLVRDERLRRTLGARGAERARQRHSWHVTAHQVIQRVERQYVVPLAG